MANAEWLGLVLSLFHWSTLATGTDILTSALQKEPVAGVAIINYSGLIYALLIGSLVFGETQTAESLSGMLLVVFGVFVKCRL